MNEMEEHGFQVRVKND